MQKRALITSAFVLLALLSIPSVLATWPMDVDPKRIPPGGTVTIYIENTGTSDMTIVKIEVTGPDNTIYTKIEGVVLPPGDNFSDTFGHGDTSWSPTADTSQEGKYKVHVYGPENVDHYFDVSSMFSVPELLLPLVMVLSMATIILFLYKRKNQPH